MQSIAYIPGSNGSANASLMTVQTLRSPGATTILVNTVANVPAKFYATMGTPHTFTDPVTGEVITIVSEATAVDFAGHVNGSSIVIDEIAPGYEDTNGSAVGDIIVIKQNTEWANNLHNILGAAHNDDGTLQNTALDPFFKPSEIIHNFVASGGTIAQTTGLTGSFADIVYYIAGLRHSVTGIANKTYTVSKDTYVDIADDGTVTYVEVANGATTGMALTTNSVRVAKVVTNGSGITSVVQSGVDPLGNSIKPAGAIGAQNMDLPTLSSVSWVEIGRTTLSSSAASMVVTSLPAYTHLHVLISAFLTSSSSLTINLNNDIGNNYNRRVSVNGATDSTTASSTNGLIATGADPNGIFIDLNLFNFAGKEKAAIAHVNKLGTAGATNMTSREEWNAKWSNTSSQVNEIDVFSSGTLAPGSEVIVFGRN